MYYLDKLETLKDLFGTMKVQIEPDAVTINGRRYPIVDDVIVLLDPSQYPPMMARKLAAKLAKHQDAEDFAEDIQFTFSEEWLHFPRILDDYRSEFEQYFDLVRCEDLHSARVCDLGCGIGRWSYYLAGYCKELILIDFSDAIFIARRNLINYKNVFFFMADIKKLPFRENFADFLVCIGVLHHLITPALNEVRALRRFAPRLLIYLYYALDNRPSYFALILRLITIIRIWLSRLRGRNTRNFISWFGTLMIYKPLVLLGAILSPFGLAKYVPLYETYYGKSLERIRQDVYDRFFTRIEQRYSRNQIEGLRDVFKNITISNRPPYWHFLCEVDESSARGES